MLEMYRHYSQPNYWCIITVFLFTFYAECAKTALNIFANPFNVDLLTSRLWPNANVTRWIQNMNFPPIIRQ